MPVGVAVPIDWRTVALSVIEVFSVTLLEDTDKEVTVATTGCVTLIDNPTDVDALNVDVPAYAAVITSVPAGKDDVVRLADPAASVADPIKAVPL